MTPRFASTCVLALLTACACAAIVSGCSSAKDDAQLTKLKSEQDSLKRDIKDLRSDLGKPAEKP